MLDRDLREAGVSDDGLTVTVSGTNEGEPALP
jgi:hypothetical protein